LKITVLLGGTSAERDVSLASGVRIAQALRSRGHEVTSVDTARGVLDEADERALAGGGAIKTAPPSLEALEELSRTSLSPALATLPAIRTAEVVFLGLHGGQGEDGTIQALLDLAGVTYTGSGHLASALAMDKDLSKQLFRAAGVGTADWMMAPRNGGQGSGVGGRQAFARKAVGALGLPVVVKPSKQGSTVGLTVVKKREQFLPAVDEAFRFDDEVMIERFIPGRELTVPVIGGEALPVGEIIPKNEIYDYECKYTKGMAVEEFPARLSRKETAEVQRQAVAAFTALKLSGCARIDFRMSPDGALHCLEANTLPGMTELSLVPQSAAAAGISFPELCERIALIARDGAAERAR
jgi:D-alanine-D-alanine ligase